MMVLKEILYKAGIRDVLGSTDVVITSMTFDSRHAETYGLFVAIRGEKSDGHDYIAQAIENGAAAIVCETFPDEIRKEITYVQVNDSQQALGQMASNFYGNPSQKIKLVGVTGTNGKTTIATLLYKLFNNLGHPSGLLSTISYRIGHEEIPATHTTPDAIRINEMLARMVEKHCTHCFMEVSSHAVQQGRTSGLTFTGGIFTNLTHDHLDYHGSFDAYLKAKKKFFDQLPQDAFALVNKDDVHGEIMIQNCKALRKTYACHHLADFKCKILDNQFSGLHLLLDDTEIWTKLIGSFNASNMLAIYGAALLLGEDRMDVLTAISNLNPVEGRFQYIRAGNVTGIVDYAHTPDALENVLATVADIRTGNEQVITIIGCGGDRDKAKRPLMAAIACNHSDKVILTSDNPRSEDPHTIIKDMEAGVPGEHVRKCLTIPDRREAIKTACALARPGDIILLAGKGHEKYQEINGVRHPFDDLEVLKIQFDLTLNR
ncbi:MAG: UDP-N-acetylmuramoyl-L-alanyl-D-glutamate--2,6-diaminopimelate ligase [Flavobacteriales bacterium]|nr:UDP-N-acetylmuramoyl-L-alanyl-D-glutamate--2,6-diaminopimelate ligase [Flavobacteriales bacterium]MCB9449364.1 UDP-N-acetylmuramoyl-L-alanyl-D-glutamate--2,6-diaminopimelate ligase [Flavobacteriales bacterium]